jgi:hypothetical protein
LYAKRILRDISAPPTRRSRVALWIGVALFLGACAGSGRSDSAAVVAPQPDWVARGGRTPRYPDAQFITGYGLADGPDAVATARQRAAADLAARLEVRIEHELRDVTEEKDGVARYHVAALTRSTVDIRLSGIDYETWQQGRSAHALAVLLRAQAADGRRAERDRALTELRTCLATAARLESDGRKADGVATLEGCRRPLVAALEHIAVSTALVGADAGDRAAHGELVEARHHIELAISEILRSPARDLPAAADALALQLARQGVSVESTLLVRPFTYGTADVSSGFGRQVALDLESALARHARRGADAAIPERVALHGIYVQGADGVRIDVTAKDAYSAQLVASASTILPVAAVPAHLELRPPNYVDAIAAQKALSDGGLVTGDLRLDLWTSHGRRGVVLGEDDEYRIYLKVNQPAWVRLVYVLAGGEQVPIEQAFRIDRTRAGDVVAYPHIFEVVPPFGVEHFHATAFTERPRPLRTRDVTIAGEPYRVAVDGFGEIRRARSRRIENDEQVAEAFVAVTTVAGSRRATPRAREVSR